MDNIPEELQETQLNLQVVVDPETKCITMKTHTEDMPTNCDILSTDIISNDPLYQPVLDEADLEKMNELERLIFSERRRLLNLKITKKSAPLNKRGTSKESTMFETASCELTKKEKSKLRMRKYREQVPSEERDFRRFRDRIITMKARLIQKLRNFENETFLEALTKRNSERTKQKRQELIANETPEQKALRKHRINTKSRLAKMRRKSFKTPEELLQDKEKRWAYLERFWSRRTEEERKAHQKLAKEKAKEKRRENNKEWKKVELIIKGTPMKE